MASYTPSVPVHAPQCVSSMCSHRHNLTVTPPPPPPPHRSVQRWAKLLLGNEGTEMEPDSSTGAALSWALDPPSSAPANPHSILGTSPREALSSHLASQLAAAQPVRALWWTTSVPKHVPLRSSSKTHSSLRKLPTCVRTRAVQCTCGRAQG